MKKIAIFGAGDVGTKVLNVVGKENVRCFIDNNPKSDILFDIPCMTFDEYLKIKDETIVIVASFNYANDMCKQLEMNKIFDYRICHRHNLEMFPYYYSYINKKSIYYSYFDLIRNYELSKYNYITVYCYPENIELLMWVFEIAGIIDRIKRVIPYTVIGTEKILWQEIESKSDCVVLAVKRNHSHFYDIIELEGEKCNSGELAVADFNNVDIFVDDFQNPEIKKYKDINKGKSCFIIGNGPSLRMSDLDKLKENNEICFGTNKIWYAFEDTEWRPDYYLAQDIYITHQHPEKISEINSIKFIADRDPDFWESEYSDKCLKFHIKDNRFEPNMPEFSTDFSIYSIEGTSVTYTAIQLAVYMGFSEIFLLGVDCDYSGDMRKGENYFSKKYVAESDQYGGTSPNRLYLAYKKAELVSQLHNIKIYNATRGGKLEAFERVSIDDVL